MSARGNSGREGFEIALGLGNGIACGRSCISICFSIAGRLDGGFDSLIMCGGNDIKG